MDDPFATFALKNLVDLQIDTSTSPKDEANEETKKRDCTLESERESKEWFDARLD